MNDDMIQKIVDALDTRIKDRIKPLQEGQERVEKRLATIDQDQSHMSTAIEALAEGQREIRETMATKADILDLGVKINKNHLSTKTRLENLEDHTGTHDPTEN